MIHAIRSILFINNELLVKSERMQLKIYIDKMNLWLEYHSSSNIGILNCGNILTFRHLNIWNSLSNKVVQKTSSFKLLLNKNDLSDYLIYNRKL